MTTTETHDVEGKNQERLGTVVDEAFCILMLKNNYYSWLLEAKDKLPSLMTDYDVKNLKKEEIAHFQDINEAYVHVEIDLHADGMYEDNFDPKKIIVRNGDALFKEMKKSSKKELDDVRKEVKNSDMYRRIVEIINDKDVGEGEERKAKRRKVIHSFRQYTAQQENEGRFKGWSKRAAEDMLQIKKDLMKDEKETNLFSLAYRMILKDRQDQKDKEQQKKKSNNKVNEGTVKELFDDEEVEEVEV